MKFYSTKKESSDVDFKTALFQGIAPDGGLYMPREIPHLDLSKLNNRSSLQEVGFAVLREWIDRTEISDEKLKQIVDDSFTFPIPLVQVGEASILELFHGPTMAFKDIAARVLARLFEFYLEKEKKSVTILVATSGDTGGAIAQAFSGVSHVNVVILYPEGKVSELQEEQLTRVGDNVVSLAVNGDFDDCQSFVKKAFQDEDLKKYNLSSANSINIGRLIPQIIYYVYAYLQTGSEVRFVVPSGNLGNATAALLAQRMGVLIKSLVIATNENDVAVKYYETGIYKSKKTIRTLSTAMDIGSPNNFERILELFHYGHGEFRHIITAIKVSDSQTIETIQQIYSLDNYLMDFHTAVGYNAAQKLEVSGMSTIVVSTASPLKFAKEMKQETGIVIDNKEVMKQLQKKKKKVVLAHKEYEVIKKIVVTQIA